MSNTYVTLIHNSESCVPETLVADWSSPQHSWQAWQALEWIGPGEKSHFPVNQDLTLKSRDMTTDWTATTPADKSVERVSHHSDWTQARRTTSHGRRQGTLEKARVMRSSQQHEEMMCIVRMMRRCVIVTDHQRTPCWTDTHAYNQPAATIKITHSCPYTALRHTTAKCTVLFTTVLRWVAVMSCLTYYKSVWRWYSRAICWPVQNIPNET